MFNLKEYIKVGNVYLKYDNNGRITAHMNIDIDNDKIHKEIEELCENLQSLHKILGYDFTLTVNENDIIFEELNDKKLIVKEILDVGLYTKDDEKIMDLIKEAREELIGKEIIINKKEQKC